MPAPPSPSVKAQNDAKIAASRTTTTTTGARGPTGPQGQTSVTGSKGSTVSGYGSNTTSGTQTRAASSSNKPASTSSSSVPSRAAESSNYRGPTGPQGQPTSQRQTGYNPSRGTMAGAPPSSNAPLGQTYRSSSGPGTPRGATPVTSGSSRVGTAGLNAAAGNTSIAGNMVPREVADAIRTSSTYGGIQKWQLNSMAETYRKRGMDLTANKLTEMARTISGEAINQTPDQQAAVANVMGNRLALGTSYPSMMRAFDANGYDASRVGNSNAVFNRTQLGTPQMARGIAAIANAASPTSSFALNAPSAVQNATHYYNPQDANPAWGTRGGNQFTAYGDHVFGNPDQSPATVQAARASVGGPTTVASAPIQPQTPAGTQPIPSPTGRLLGQSQNMQLPPPNFQPAADTVGPRNPIGGMSFTPKLPPESVQAGPVAPAQTAEQRMGMTLPPPIPPAPAPRNPVSGMSFTPGLPAPQERVSAVAPSAQFNDQGRRLNPPGFRAPPVALNDTGRRLTVASQPVTSVAPGQEAASPSQELVSPEKIQKQRETGQAIGQVLGDAIVPGLGVITGKIGAQLGELNATRRERIASNPKALKDNAFAINKYSEDKGMGKNSGMYVTEKGLKDVLTNPKKVLNAKPTEYTPLERLMAKIDASVKGGTSTNSGDMAYLNKLSMGYQPFDNTYVSSY